MSTAKSRRTGSGRTSSAKLAELAAGTLTPNHLVDKITWEIEVTKMTDPAGRTRLTVYVPPDVKRRLRMAAAKGDMTMGEYLLEAIGSRLDRDVPPADDLLRASEASLSFWDNPVDDEVWNDA